MEYAAIKRNMPIYAAARMAMKTLVLSKRSQTPGERILCEPTSMRVQSRQRQSVASKQIRGAGAGVVLAGQREHLRDEWGVTCICQNSSTCA